MGLEKDSVLYDEVEKICARSGNKLRNCMTTLIQRAYSMGFSAGKKELAEELDSEIKVGDEVDLLLCGSLSTKGIIVTFVDNNILQGIMRNTGETKSFSRYSDSMSFVKTGRHCNITGLYEQLSIQPIKNQEEL